MKKFTVCFTLQLDATFEGIEAETKEEAKETAIEMLCDNIEQYLDFSNTRQVSILEWT